MSEERRKRQQQREGTQQPKSSRRFVWVVIVVVLFAAAYCAGWYRKNHRLDAFARCVASKQARMYGLYWCPHCADQKEMFGASFRYIPYQECAVKNSPHQLTEECKAAGAKLFPSWQFGNNPPKEGVLSLDELRDKTGCSLP
jgi:glutaredoxin